jgi:hypothetical protein
MSLLRCGQAQHYEDIQLTVMNGLMHNLLSPVTVINDWVLDWILDLLTT